MERATLLLPWGPLAAAATPGASARPWCCRCRWRRSPPGPARDIDVLAYAGYPHKRGLDLLCQAWIEAAHPGERLFIGGVERARALDWLERRGAPVPPGIEWIGPLPREQWLHRLSRTRVFVNASRREDHGLAQLEALSAGCALVTVPSPGAYEALPLARRLAPELVAADSTPAELARSLRAGLDLRHRDEYAAGARELLEPFRADCRAARAGRAGAARPGGAMNEPRVLVLHNRYRVHGGEERAVDLHLAALLEAGVKHRALMRDSAGAGRARAAGGMLRGGHGPQEVARAAWELGANVVHAHNIQPLFGPRALAAARAGGARTVLHLHNFRLFCAIGVAFRDGKPCFRCHHGRTLPGLVLNCRSSLPEAGVYATALKRQLPRCWTSWTASSRPAATSPAGSCSSACPAERLEALPHYLPSESIAEASAAHEGRFALVVGRLSAEKGIDVAIEAAAAAGVPLKVAGAGPQEFELRAVARRVAGQVEWLGRVSPEELAELRRQAAVALVPSRSDESFGLAALEAMGAGVPVVASDAGALPELVGERALRAPWRQLRDGRAARRPLGGSRAAAQRGRRADRPRARALRRGALQRGSARSLPAVMARRCDPHPRRVRARRGAPVARARRRHRPGGAQRRARRPPPRLPHDARQLARDPRLGLLRGARHSGDRGHLRRGVHRGQAGGRAGAARARHPVAARRPYLEEGGSPGRQAAARRAPDERRQPQAGCVLRRPVPAVRAARGAGAAVGAADGRHDRGLRPGLVLAARLPGGEGQAGLRRGPVAAALRAAHRRGARLGGEGPDRGSDAGLAARW